MRFTAILTLALLVVLSMTAMAMTKAEIDKTELPPVPASRGLLDCTNAIPIACGQTLSGDNTGAPNNVVNYGCTTLNENGGEVVYEFVIPAGVCYDVTITMVPAGCDLDLFFLGSCDEADCIAHSAGVSTETILTGCKLPGTYYIVVDGYGSTYPGAECAFDITVECVECECPVPACCPFDYTCHENDFNVSDNGVMFVDCGFGPNPWAWGMDAGIPQVACDDVPVTNILGTLLGGPYAASTGGIAQIGPFDVTPECTCLELCHFYDFETNYDGGNVKVSVDGGATWQLITPTRGYDGVLSSTAYPAECVANEMVFTGNSASFVRDCFSLQSFLGQQVLIGFFFGSESYATSDLGWYIKWAKVGGTEFSPVQDSTWGTIKSLYR
jgi:hypothetical protein